jgi:hypothetical protein
MLFQIPAFLTERLQRYLYGEMQVNNGTCRVQKQYTYTTVQGYTKPERLVAEASKFCTVALVWNLLCVTQLMPRI